MEFMINGFKRVNSPQNRISKRIKIWIHDENGDSIDVPDKEERVRQMAEIVTGEAMYKGESVTASFGDGVFVTAYGE